MNTESLLIIRGSDVQYKFVQADLVHMPDHLIMYTGIIISSLQTQTGLSASTAHREAHSNALLIALW